MHTAADAAFGAQGGQAGLQGVRVQHFHGQAVVFGPGAGQRGFGGEGLGAAEEFDPAVTAYEGLQAGGGDEGLVLGHTSFDERAHVLGGAGQGRGGRFVPVALQPAGVPGQGTPLEAQGAVGVGGHAQHRAGVARHGVGHEAGTLDEAGVAEAGAPARVFLVDEADAATLGLQRQRCTDPHDAGAEDDDIGGKTLGTGHG